MGEELYCERCDKSTPHQRVESFLFHLCLAVFTGGLWLPVWFFLWVFRGRPEPRCSVCAWYRRCMPSITVEGMK